MCVDICRPSGSPPSSKLARAGHGAVAVNGWQRRVHHCKYVLPPLQFDSRPSHTHNHSSGIGASDFSEGGARHRWMVVPWRHAEAPPASNDACIPPPASLHLHFSSLSDTLACCRVLQPAHKQQRWRCQPWSRLWPRPAAPTRSPPAFGRRTEPQGSGRSQTCCTRPCSGAQAAWRDRIWAWRNGSNHQVVPSPSPL